MPQPYDYSTRGVDVDNYFDAFRKGREDRLAVEGEARNKQLASYLPGALKGDAGMRDQALATATPDQQIALSGSFAQLDATKLAQVREKHGRLASLLLGVQNKQIGLDDAKRLAVSELGVDPMKVANITEADIPGFIAQTQTVAEQLDRADKERSYLLDASRTKAQNAASYASADAARAAAEKSRATPVPVGPKFSTKTQATLDAFRKEADASARGAAALQNILPNLKASENAMGPGFGGKRNVAGVMSIIPGVTAAERMLGGDSVTDAIVQNYDAIEQASKDLGIAKLSEIGGSDTERELLTAIQTTVNPGVTAVENARRFKSQLGAATILAQKADLATKWANAFGDMDRLSSDGESWQGFWSKYQKAAWQDYLSKTPDAFGPGARRPPAAARPNYREEQRGLLDQPRQQGPAIPPPPPGSRIIR